MRTKDDIEAYLRRSGHPFTELKESTWLVGDPSGTHENIVILVEGDLVLFRMKVLDLSSIDDKSARDFYRTLLELNASDMVHGAYGLSGGMVTLTASLPLENLDYNECVGVVEDFVLAMTKHHARLAVFQKNK